MSSGHFVVGNEHSFVLLCRWLAGGLCALMVRVWADNVLGNILSKIWWSPSLEPTILAEINRVCVLYSYVRKKMRIYADIWFWWKTFMVVYKVWADSMKIFLESVQRYKCWGIHMPNYLLLRNIQFYWKCHTCRRLCGSFELVMGINVLGWCKEAEKNI